MTRTTLILALLLAPQRAGAQPALPPAASPPVATTATEPDAPADTPSPSPSPLTSPSPAAATATATGMPAAAPTPAEAEARRLFVEAQRDFDLGEYRDAIAKYRAAYRLDPRPGLLFNLGQAYRLEGDCVSAQNLYRSYLRLEPQSRYRDLVEQHLASIEGCARDQAQAGKRTAFDPSETGDEVAVVATVDRPASGRTRRISGLATIGGGVVVAAVGGWFAVDAYRASEKVSDAYARGGRWDEIEDLDARGRRSQTIGAVCLGVGAVAVAAGAGLYVLGVRADRDATLSVAPAHRGATVGVSWSW